MDALIVDDSPVALRMLARTLTEGGYNVQTAQSGHEALDILRSCGQRLVISDWEMPGMDGLSLCRAIRNGQFQRYIYVLLVTVRRKSEDVVEGLDAGADDFLTKPVNPAELLGRIRVGERILGLETRDLALFSMAKLAESRDPETGAHLERVRSYSTAMARVLSRQPKYHEEITADFIRLIGETSPLHDIGKVGIPDAILLKPGRLEPGEFEIMKTHTTIGARTLEAALHQYPGAQYLQMARDIAQSHHERWDGKGYPEGLAGDRIPLSARIVALADVYDALTSKRVYKDALPAEKARDIVYEGAGQHFDPDVVQAMVQADQEFTDIHETFRDGLVGAA